MNANSNKQAVIAAIWADPSRLLGGLWKQGRNSWEYITGVDGWDRRGAVRLLQSANGEGIRLFFNHDSGRAGQTPDVFTFVQERDGLGGFWETLQHIAAVYNVPLEMTGEQREQIQRAQLAREVFPSLREALRLNPDGEAAQYLRNTRGFDTFGEWFGELSPDSIKRAKNALKLRNKAYKQEDFDALGLTDKRAAAGYTVVIPYYKNGQIQGFLYRNTQNREPKYLCASGTKRGFYCGRLVYGEPAYIVEGEIDAIRLLQAAEKSNGEIQNVIAMGTAKAGDDLAALLRSHGITSVVYVPDREHDAQGKQKTEIITAAVRRFETLTGETGEPLIKTPLIAELDTPDGADLRGLKIDVDSYGRDYGPKRLAACVTLEAVPCWQWELQRLQEWEREQRAASGLAVADVQERFADIYTRCGSPMERERIKRTIGAEPLAAVFAPYGITPAALNDTDEWNRNRQYNNLMKQGAADLNAAIQQQANPETVGAIVRKLADAQGTNTRAEWEAQLSETFADELDAIRDQPDTLRTVWEVGTVPTKGENAGKYTRSEYVEFYPADITVFCAPTSHGKTMLLFQAAINAVRDTPKTYIYVSCEESKRQLTERALNVALNIPTTTTGREKNETNGAPCFITGTRKRTIKAIIRKTKPPQEYRADTIDGRAAFDKLERRVNAEIQRYADEIRPRLKFVHTEGGAESITANVLYYVEQYRKQGVEVGGVFVDYMQLLTTDARSFSRHDELKDICKALKDCAARTELPVIIAAQLNREVLRPNSGGIDNISVANIGEGADVERIAHDIFLLWQVDKTPLGLYSLPNDRGEMEVKPNKLGIRSARLFSHGLRPEDTQLKAGYLYVEQMKARDGKTGGWGLFPFDGERGYIGPIDQQTMKQ